MMTAQDAFIITSRLAIVEKRPRRGSARDCGAGYRHRIYDSHLFCRSRGTAEAVGLQRSRALCDALRRMFALALAVACGIFFSISPLWQARRIAPNQALTEGSRASAGTRSRGLLRVFVVAEVALAFGLLAVGGLIVEQLTHLHRVHPGFDPNHLLVMSVYAPVTKYKPAKRKSLTRHV